LPSLDALNSSLYVVYSGFQDYMSGFYDDSLTSQQASANVPSVVQAIVAAVQVHYIWYHLKPKLAPDGQEL
jgi:hypothetical protein